MGVSVIKYQGITDRKNDAILNFDNTYFENCSSAIIVKGNIAWLQFSFKTKSNVPSRAVKLGDFNFSKYTYKTYRPIIVLINDDTALPEGSAYINSNSYTGLGDINCYGLQPGHIYIGQTIIFMKKWLE